jgi:ABC-type oligopeptide transport system substrate-binding subunit
MRLLVPGAPRPHTPRVHVAMQALVEQFRAVDVAVEAIIPASASEFARVAESNDYDLALSGWTPDTLVATDTLEALFGSTSVPQPARSVSACANLARFGNIELDKALSTAARSGAAPSVTAVLELVERHALVVPLTCGARTIVVRRDVPLAAGFAIDRPQFVA